MAKVKSRSHAGYYASGSYRTSGFAAWRPWSFMLVSDYYQVTQSHAGPPYKFGGNWLLERTEHSGSPGGADGTLFKGPLLIGTPSAGFLPPTRGPILSDDEVKELGQKLSQDAIPTAPSVDAPTVFGEIIKDGFPTRAMLDNIRQQASLLKKSGGEYLNLQFGWKPLMSDMRRLLYTIKNSERVVDGYLKNANGWHNQTRSIPATREVTNYSGGFTCYPAVANHFFTGSAQYLSETKVWFKGTFRYFVPVGNGFGDRMRRYRKEADKLLGLQFPPSPDQIWNLTPWSWMADWFVDIGGFYETLGNMGPDGAAMRSGYLMHSKSLTTTMGGTIKTGNLAGISSSRQVKEVYKGRAVNASPFGFDTSWEGLSPYQLSIVAAIGITRS